MSEQLTLTPFELDALREIANIGSGHAATVLSKMTGTRIMIDVPVIRVEKLATVTSGLAQPDDAVVALSMRMLGDLSGDTFFLLHERNAAVLCDLLLSRPPGTGTVKGVMEESALKEAGNIMAAGFMNALSTCLQVILLPSVPTLVTGRAGSLTVMSQPAGRSDAPVLTAVTAFRFDDPALASNTLQGVFLFALERASLEALFGYVRRFAPRQS
jgi:chemotaxis protein CheC